MRFSNTVFYVYPRKCITTSHFYPFHATKNMCLAISVNINIVYYIIPTPNSYKICLYTSSLKQEEDETGGSCVPSLSLPGHYQQEWPNTLIFRTVRIIKLCQEAKIGSRAVDSIRFLESNASSILGTLT